MSIKRFVCPHCNATNKVDMPDGERLFCSYCGSEIVSGYNETKKTININKNIYVNKTIHNRITDDADIIRATAEAKQNKRELITVVAILGMFLLIAALCIGIPALIHATNETNGKVNAGFYRDLIGEDYKSVEAHFESAGFTNIELIDLDDSGVAFWKEGKVETISVGGKTSFDSMDWFDPNTKVVISYH